MTQGTFRILLATIIGAAFAGCGMNEPDPELMGQLQQAQQQMADMKDAISDMKNQQQQQPPPSNAEPKQQPPPDNSRLIAQIAALQSAVDRQTTKIKQLEDKLDELGGLPTPQEPATPANGPDVPEEEE